MAGQADKAGSDIGFSGVFAAQSGDSDDIRDCDLRDVFVFGGAQAGHRAAASNGGA